MERRIGRRPLPPSTPRILVSWPAHVMLLLLLLQLLLPTARAYPAYLLDPEGCVEKKLEVGFVLMGKPSVADKQRWSPIRVR